MKRDGKLLAAPYTLWMVAFIVIPLFFILFYGFTDNDFAFTLSSIRSVSSPVNLKALMLSIELSLISTVLCLIFAYPLAMILKGKGKNSGSFIVLIFILPMWMNFLLRTFAWQTLLDKNGVINTFLSAVGLPKQNIINTPAAIIRYPPRRLVLSQFS